MMSEQNKQYEFRHLGREFTFYPFSVSPPLLPEDSFPTITSMALDISGKCNLRCVYCAESITLPSRPVTPRYILHNAVDTVFKWSLPGSGVSLHLGSGEALLYPNTVLEIGRRAKKLAQSQSRPLALHLTTNGTQLSETIICQLIEDGWNIKISIDGGIDIHDHYRVDKRGRGTFKRIEQTVRTLAAKIPEQFSTTSVLCHGTDPQQVFYAIASMGVRKIELVPVAAPYSSPFALHEDDLAAYRYFIFDYAQRIARGENIPIHIRFLKRLQKVLGYYNTRISCGAGRNFIATGPDGTLYPCFRFIGLQHYQLGDLNSGIKPDRMQWFIKGPGRSYEQRELCEKCWAAPLCGGPCFACAELLGRADGSPSIEYCSMVRSESEAAIWLATILREENPMKLLELLGVKVEEL